MRCPYCDTPLEPAAEQCGECHLTFSKACSLFGVAPRISRDVYDSTHHLTASAAAAIQRRMDRLIRKYPELELRLVIHSFPQPHPLKTYTFWLFNAAELSSTSHRGSRNHLLLVLIDPSREEVAMMPGYGLEPLAPPEIMDSMLAEAAHLLNENRIQEAYESILTRLDAHLMTVAEPATDWHVASAEF